MSNKPNSSVSIDLFDKFGSSESTRDGFDKLFESVTDPQSCDNHARHYVLSKSIIYHNENGWKLMELPLVSVFLLKLRDKIRNNHEEFSDILLAAITICGEPFVRLKCNEEISNPTLLNEIIPTLAEFLSFDRLEISLAAAEALRLFVTGFSLSPGTKRSNINKTDDLNTAGHFSLRLFSQNLMEQSGAVDLIIGVLFNLFPDAYASQDMALISKQGAKKCSNIAEVVRQENHSLDNVMTSNGEGVTQDTPETSTADEVTKDESKSGEVKEDEMYVHQEKHRESMIFPIFTIVHELSDHQQSAQVFVLTGAIHCIVYAISEVTCAQDEILPLCIDILWKLLELCDNDTKCVRKCATRRELLVRFRLRNAVYCLQHRFVFSTLLRILELLLRDGYRSPDKELRNVCLIILVILARRRASLDHFFTSGITSCLLAYAVHAEASRCKSHNSVLNRPSSNIMASYHNYATNCDEDLEFKQMLWYLIGEITFRHQENREELVQFQFAVILLKYATQNFVAVHENKMTANMFSYTHQHTQPQCDLLQITAIQVLNRIATPLREHLHSINSPEVLLQYLLSNLLSNEIQAALWILLLQLSPPISSYQLEMGRVGCIKAALSTLKSPTSLEASKLQRNAILTCARVCYNNDVNRKIFLEQNGVVLLMSSLECRLSRTSLDESFLIALIEAIRSCVLGNIESEHIMIKEDGIPRLLDLLEISSKVIQNQVLATLAEICINPASISTYTTWRSSSGTNRNVTANQLLLHIFTCEFQQEKDALHSSEVGENQIMDATKVSHNALKSILTCRSPVLIFSSITDNEKMYEHEESPASNASPKNYHDLKSSKITPRNAHFLPDANSTAFNRLNEALIASHDIDYVPYATDSSSDSWRKYGTASFPHNFDEKDVQHTYAIDLKAKICCILISTSFVGLEQPQLTLTLDEQLALEFAKEYSTFKTGEMWQNVEVSLQAEGIRPIYADALHIRKQIEFAYNTAITLNETQNQINLTHKTSQLQEEENFYRQILEQKEQEAQAQVFQNINRQANSTMELHLDAKRTRLELLSIQDPTAYVTYQQGLTAKLDDPAPDYFEEVNTLEEKEAELQGRLDTLFKRQD